MVQNPNGPVRGPMNPNESELQHATMMMARRSDLKYAPGLGWLQWNGAKWQDNAEAELMAEVMRSANAAQMITTNAFTKRLCSAEGIAAVAKIAQWLEGSRVLPKDLDAHRDWIHTAGLTWDLRTGNAWPSDPSELNTRCLQWEPNAGCPEWEATLDRCFPGEPEIVSYLQRLVGYGITGQTSERVFVLMHGNGANGKTVFANVLTHVFKEYVRHIPVEVLMNTAQRSGESPSPMLMELRGARMVFTSETERGGRLNEPMVKLLTGGDEITARALRKDPVTFKPEALVFMATNHKPDIQGTDDGIWRRVKLVEWRESFKGREDHGIEDRLKAEAPGIINWALDGAIEWYSGKLREPERIMADTKRYKEESDFFGSFMPEWIQIDPESWLPRREIVAAWQEFCEANGRMPLRNNATLFAALRERGAQDAGRKGTDGFRVRRVQ